MNKKNQVTKKRKGNHLAGRMMVMAVCVFAFVLMAGCGKKEVEESAITEIEGVTEEIQQIRVGSLLALGTVTPFVSHELGYFEKAGLDVEIVEFADGAALMEAFATGELDLALVGVIPAATWYSKGVDLQVVATANGGGHVVMARSDSGIDSIEGLKGKMIAEPSIATVTDALLRSRILKDAGLKPEIDITMITGTKPADMPTALMATKEVDAIVTWEPYAAAAQAEYGEDIKVLYNAAEEVTTDGDYFYPGNVVIASGSFIKDQSENLEKYLDIHKKTVDYMNTDQDANAVLSKLLQIDETIVQQARMRTDFQTEVHEDAAMEILGWSLELGYLEELPNSEQFFRKGTVNAEE